MYQIGAGNQDVFVSRRKTNAQAPTVFLYITFALSLFKTKQNVFSPTTNNLFFQICSPLLSPLPQIHFICRGRGYRNF